MTKEGRWRAQILWILGASVLLITANFLFYIFGVSNLDKMTRSLKAKAQSNRGQLAELESVARTLAGSSGKISRGRSFMDTLSSETLKTRSARFPAVQEELAKLMKDTGVSSDQISYGYEMIPKKTEKKRWRRDYIKATVQLTVTGSYPQVKSFIRELQASGQFFVMESLSVANTTQGAVLLRSTMVFSTYFIAEETDRTA